MKKIIYIILTLIPFLSCKTPTATSSLHNEDATIVYLFPETVSKLLSGEIIRRNTNFYLDLQVEADTFRLMLMQIPNESKNLWIIKSQRKAYVDGKLYPIRFDYDRIFAIEESFDELKLKFKQDQYPLITRTYSFENGAFYIMFLKGGKIIETGYNGAEL